MVGRDLDLSHQGLTAWGLAELARSGGIEGVEALGLNHNELGDLGVAILASSPDLGQLRELSLAASGLTSSGAVALTRAPMMPPLTRLVLDGNDLFTAGVKALAASPSLGSLVELRLDDNVLDDEGSYALARSEHLRALEVLSVEGNFFTAQGAAALAEAFTGLRELRLGDQKTAPTDEGEAPPGSLTLLHDNQAIPITRDDFVIGRIPSADLVIRQAYIGRRHCAVRYRRRRYYLRDLGSINTVSFNGEPSDEKLIEEGDVFAIFDTELRFTYRDLGRSDLGRSDLGLRPRL